jgi:hypothetical protein
MQPDVWRDQFQKPSRCAGRLFAVKLNNVYRCANLPADSDGFSSLVGGNCW